MHRYNTLIDRRSSRRGLQRTVAHVRSGARGVVSNDTDGIALIPFFIRNFRSDNRDVGGRVIIGELKNYDALSQCDVDC